MLALRFFTLQEEVLGKLFGFKTHHIIALGPEHGEGLVGEFNDVYYRRTSQAPIHSLNA